MCDWNRYVRENLSLPELEEHREREIIAELASQLDDVYQDALSKGHGKEESRALAAAHIPDWIGFANELRLAECSRKRATGDAWAEDTSETLRERGGLWAIAADLIQDLRYSLRSLRASPGFTSVALTTLALGIGGVATIFTLYDQVLVRPLPYEDSGELVQLWERMASFENASVSYPNFLDWRERNRVFEDVAVWNETTMTLTGSGDPEEVLIARVSASVFPLLRVSPFLGRTLLPEEDEPGSAPVLVLSHSYWQERFGSDPTVVGRAVDLDGLPAEVVGVLPAGFHFPPGWSRVDFYAPVEVFAEGWRLNRDNHPGLTGLARLRPGVSLEQAQQDMDRIAAELETEYPASNEGSGVHVAPFHERVTRGARDPILLLLLAVSLLFIIACINVASLVLARTTGRAREMAVRASLGAEGSRIIRLLLTETLLLWILGGAMGLVLALFGVQWIMVLLAEQIPPVFNVGLDLRAVGGLLGISLVVGLAFGLPPVLQVVRQDLREFLKDGNRTSLALGRTRFRSGLVMAEVSLAVALLVGAGLTLRSYSRISETNPGIVSENVLVVEVNLPDLRYPDTEGRTAFFTRLLDRTRNIPGVVSAATSYTVPLGPGGWQNGYHVEGQPAEEPGQLSFSEVNAVSTGYFESMGIPMSRGRDFSRRDNENSNLVVIVDESMVDLYWPDEDPIGKRIKWGGYATESQWREVVGVVGHVKVNGVVSRALPQIYLPHWQDNDSGYYLIIKTQGDPLRLAESLRNAVLTLDPAQPLASVGTMAGYTRETTRSQELLALLMGLFSVAAVLLAGVGIYGIMAQMTAERRHEIGVRVALGARADQVLKMVFRQGMKVVALGIVMGMGVAVVVGRLISSQLYQISVFDPPTFLLTPVVVVVVAVAAHLLPARRATKVDPVRALQAE